MSFTNKIDEWMKEAETKTGTSHQTCLFIFLKKLSRLCFYKYLTAFINSSAVTPSNSFVTRF